MTNDQNNRNRNGNGDIVAGNHLEAASFTFCRFRLLRRVRPVGRLRSGRPGDILPVFIIWLSLKVDRDIIKVITIVMSTANRNHPTSSNRFESGTTD